MFINLLKLFFLTSIGFASMQGYGHHANVEVLYEKQLKPTFEKIAPLKEYAQKQQTTFIISAILAVVVFIGFVKYFKLLGAIVAILMIAAGIIYLKSMTPAIAPYKNAFNKNILSPIAQYTIGFEYKNQNISQEQVQKSNLFSPRIKSFDSQGLFVRDGIKFGYVDMVFNTKENASVERFNKNIFTGFVIVFESTNNTEGIMVSSSFKDKVADIDPEFSAFFTKLQRSGKKNGFELYGDISQKNLDDYYPLAGKEIAISFTKDKTYLFYFHENNPFNQNVYEHFDLQSVHALQDSFKEINKIIQQIHVIK